MVILLFCRDPSQMVDQLVNLEEGFKNACRSSQRCLLLFVGRSDSKVFRSAVYVSNSADLGE